MQNKKTNIFGATKRRGRDEESSEGGRVRCRFGRSFGFELDEAAEEGGGSGGDAGDGAG